ncbi:MAG: SHOCT domain-containing protein, partial [Gorillibacterium sp.]|nr:SHOCT domain-containing protein [Gorillibacterium sp.]
RMNSKIVVAGALALALTLGSGAWVAKDANAAEAVQKLASHFKGKAPIHAVWNDSEVAKLLGMTADELKTALKSGKSLADLAGEKGIEVQKLIDLETKALTVKLDQQLKDQKITQEQYDMMKAKIAAMASDMVKGIHNNKGLKGDLHGKLGYGVLGPNDLEATLYKSAEIASLLGLTVDELNAQLKAGKSLATIAEEKKVTVQSIITLGEKVITAALDKQLADGTLTQTQYDAMKVKIASCVTAIVNDMHMGKGPGMRGGFGFGPMMGNADLATLLKMSVDELHLALREGTSLAALAKEKNVTVAAVTAQITKTWTAMLDKKLADGALTQAQYDEIKAELSSRVTAFVNGTFMPKEGMKGMKGMEGMEGMEGMKGMGGKGHGEGGPGRHGGVFGGQK